MVVIQYEFLGFSPGVVAGKDVVISNASNIKIDAAREQGFRISKIRLFGEWHTKTTDEGPLWWGLAIGGSAAQIELVLEADPQSSFDKDETADGQWVKPCGVFPFEDTEGSLTPGMPYIEIVVNWSIPEGQAFQMWVYNQNATPTTTGLTINFFMEIFGVWLRD